MRSAQLTEISNVDISDIKIHIFGNNMGYSCILLTVVDAILLF